MANDIDNAVSRLQAIALQCNIPNASVSGTTLKLAPDYPVEDAMALPMSIAHLANGTFHPDNASTARILPIVYVDFHFSRQSIKLAYTQADAVAQEYAQRLCGDPTLNDTVSTIVFDEASFTVTPTMWDKIPTQMLRFTVPLKLLKTPTPST